MLQESVHPVTRNVFKVLDVAQHFENVALLLVDGGKYLWKQHQEIKTKSKTIKVNKCRFCQTIPHRLFESVRPA